MKSFDISFTVDNTDYTCNIGLEVLHNNKKVFDSNHINKVTEVQFTVNNKQDKHNLVFKMKNKSDDHMTFDENNNVVTDACLRIDNLKFNYIELEHTFYERCKYYHDFNGNSDKIVENFYGTMGCNGEVVFDFETPVYHWLVHNM